MISGSPFAVSLWLCSASPSWSDVTEKPPVVERFRPAGAQSSQWNLVAPQLGIISEDGSLQRLIDVLRLGPDWDGYGSPPPSEKAGEAVLGVLRESATQARLPRFSTRVFPIGGGGIQVEWHLKGRDLEIAIDPDGSATYLAAEGDAMSEGELPLRGETIQKLLGWLLS